MSKGKFICFEGVDGSGKTTLMNQYKKELEEDGYNVKVFRAIGEGYFGSQCRNLVLNFNEQTRPNPISEALIFIAAIQDCYFKYIKEWVESGGIALTDRWIYSTYTYQSTYQDKITTEQEKHLIPFETIIGLMQKMPKPDFTVIAEVTAETAIENLKERNQNNSMDQWFIDTIHELITQYKHMTSDGSIFKNDIFLTIDNNRPYPKPHGQFDKLRYHFHTNP